MAELSHQQLKLISNDVQHADISYSHLQYDLIDHICCDLENQMENGLSFENAYDIVKGKIGLLGLQQIQEDTLYLTNNKYRIMKKTMRIFGLIAPVLISFGALFKIEHLPGASILLTAGMFLLTFVFLPSAVYISYTELSNRKKLVMHLSGLLSGFFFALGFLFRIQHWPLANIFITTAVAMSGFLFIPLFYLNQIQNGAKNQKGAFIVGLLGSITYLLGFYFKINHYEGASMLILCGITVLIIIAFPMFIWSKYKSHEYVSSKFIFIMFAVIWIVVPTSLISLSSAEDVQSGFRSNEQLKTFQIQYITSQNNDLYVNIQKSLAVDSSKNIVNITDLKHQSDDLINYIQQLKIKIIIQSSGDATNQNNTIDINSISADGDEAKKVFFNEGEAPLLKKKIENYNMFITQQLSSDDKCIGFVKLLLSTSKPAENTPEEYNSWELYNFNSATIITAINKLSVIQEKIRNTENMVLKTLIKQLNSKHNINKSI